MQEKLIQGSKAEYVRAPYEGRNESGFKPIGDRVIVLPDLASGTSSGNVTLPPDLVDRMSMASETGVIIAIGPGAWKWTADRSRPFVDERPFVGDRVYFERYSGALMRGKDGRTYRLMDDKTIGATEEEAEQNANAATYMAGLAEQEAELNATA